MLLDNVVNAPILQVVQVVQFPVVPKRLSHGPDCSSDDQDSPVAGGHGDRRPCCAGRARHSCRGAEADPHGLVDHGDSPVALRCGGLCPWCAG